MNIREFFDFSSFTGTVTFFTIAGLTLIIIKLFKGKLKKEHKKPLIFFVAYFIILFFYYAYLHKEGLHSNYKYIISLILPLSVLGAYFLKQLANKNILIPTFLLFFLFGSFSNTALFCNTKGIKHKLKSSFVTPESKIVEKEFKKYKELTYDNHLYNVFHSKEPDVKGNENTVFITSSNRTMLFAMPIKLDVHQVLYKDKGLIEQSVSKISDKTKESDIVYVSQSVFPFQCSYRISFADPQYFEEAILKYFSIEEKMISYHFNGDHVFLYKMKKK